MSKDEESKITARNSAVKFDETCTKSPSKVDHSEASSANDEDHEAQQASSAAYREMARSALEASVNMECVEIVNIRLFSLDEIELEKLNRCTTLSLRKNLIHVITPLPLPLANRLVELDLFDNKIRKVGTFFTSATVESEEAPVETRSSASPLSLPGSHALADTPADVPAAIAGEEGARPRRIAQTFDRPFLALTKVDLSYNQIRRIDGFDSLAPTLKELYLIENKIKSLEGVSNLINLELLELGGNRIRDIGDHLNPLVNLRQLWLGKNKIQHIGDSLRNLRKLELLSLQANRIEVIEPNNFVEGANPALRELYLSENGIQEIAHVPVHTLVLLDFSFNPIKTISADVVNATNMPRLEEFWLTDAQVESWDEVGKLACFKDTMRTVYLERNPIEEHKRYRDMVYQYLPFVTQIDSWPVLNRGNLEADRTIQRKR